MEEDALEALAVEEILKDLKRGAERAKEHGALGWQKNPVPPTNKRFLRNMLVSTLRDDRPLTFKRKFQDGGRPQKFEDNNPRRNSDGYFRYNDKYSPRNRPDSEGRDIQESYAETYSQNDRHESDNGEAGVSFSESQHRSGYSNKRPREPSPDSQEERKNGDIKDSKKKRKKHHKKTSKKDEDEFVKKKHKKSKKAKKHKSKKSSHSTKDKS